MVGLMEPKEETEISLECTLGIGMVAQQSEVGLLFLKCLGEECCGFLDFLSG